MTSPSARARSAIASSIPSHLTWLCSNDFIQPCVAFLGPTDLIETMEQYSTSSFNVLRGGYDLTLPERGNGSDDEDEDADVIAASQAPPGIIYLTWFMNRIMYVPALRVLLFRWDGIHDNFASVRKLINDQVKTFRQCNRTRSGSLTVVIFKTSSPLEDEVLLERQMMTLRDDLGLTEDFILLSQSYRLAESMERIVSQIKENAIVSYNNCIKTLKRKRSKLGRNSHIFYLIRYHIKLGFYSFLSQDVNAAKKSFNAALKDLTELQSLSTFELIEVRDVGLIVNAMICRLLILSEDLSGAMEQFDRHIRLMSKMISEDHFAKLLRFMQFSWLQQEYLIMSFLTQASVAHCLRYVNSAANALTRRMECSFSIPDFEKHYAYQLNELMQKSPFYCGQIQRYDEEECDNTLAADLCMLAESQYRQSANATSLLTVSHNLLLAYPRKRKRQIALSELRIAKHLYSTCNYTAALPLFEKAVNIFRKERWTDMLISTLHCVRHTCVSLGLVPESILYTCELIALVQDVSTIQKELMLYLSKFHDCIDVSSTGIIALRQGPGNFSISSKFDPEVKLESIVVFDEIGNSSELCREIAISRGIPLTYQVELPIQSYAVLTMKTGAMRISVEQQHQRRCRKVGSVRVTTNLDNPTIFLQEMFPLSMKLFNAEEYGFYTFYGSQPDIVLDDDSCEPIVFGDSITFPQTKSSSGSGKVVKAQLQFQSSGSFWVSLRLLGDKIPYFEHELALRVVKPLEIIENFSSLSCTNLETSISGRLVLRLGYPSALHLHLRNASDISIHVIEVFFDYDSSFIEMKQLSSHVVGRDLSPGDCISLHFAFIPVKPCSSTIPGQIRFNWKRADASCIQTFGMPLSLPISIIAPSLYANVLIPPSEAIEIGKPCQMMVKIHSQLQVASRIRVITQAPKSVYHIVGPLKSTVLVPAQDCLILKWKLFPLQPGFQTLPSVQITNDEGESLLSDKPLAGIFVTPCMISESIS